ncbi:MAG: hypothetical protein HGA47_06885, partial [Zoogloea sp.]|nr:hypothetical protein [Zoogloea sp.]
MQDIKITLTLDGAQQAESDLAGIADGAREAGQAVYDSAAKSAEAREYVRFWEEELNRAAEAERRLAEEQAFRQKLGEAAALNRAGEYVRFWQDSLQQAEAAERRLAEEQTFQKTLADAATLTRASEYVRFWEDALQQAEETERALSEEQVFQRKLADAANLTRASEYVRFWEDSLQQAEVAEKRLAAETGFLDGLKRQSDAIGKTRADLLELQAAQLGVADQAAPFIARLREAETGMNGVGVSAGQMKAALQFLPAQITDIVTGLASGQAPMTVMIQQGGQLKDMFGGVGNAAKAVGGYVLGLINPYTLAAAAAAGLTAAYYEGSKEADAYSKALIMSGNAAGATVSQMTAQAQAVRDAAGVTQGAAASAIAQIAASGEVASGNFGRVAEAALRMQEATGQAVSETVKQFEELGKSPVQASERLN